MYRIPQAMIKQKRATAIIIADKPKWENWLGTVPSFGLPFTAKENMEVAALSDETGGKIFSADTIEELADIMNATGVATYMVDKENLVREFNEYNTAIAEGRGASLEVSRALVTQEALIEPPFYAYPVRPGIYATWGGVAINTRAQALDKNNKPIPGLYVCAPTAGGIMREIYTGAICMAGTTGWWAGNAIAEDIVLL
jgi:succinate dehydrogenase/fumarate reductase flavoprotein subunit